MAWIEQVERRTQKNKVYRDDVTGAFRAVISIHDQHYHDGSAWQDVDESLVTDGADGYARKCDKTRHVIRIGNGGTQRWYPRRNVATEYVAITAIEYYTNRWRQLNLPAAVWKSQGASWDMANLSAEIVNTWRRVKTSFVIKDATAPTRLRFALTLVGLTLDTDTWEFKSTTDGLAWGSLPPPRFTDANNNDVPVTTSYAGGYIEWSVNPTGATYPLTSHSVTFTDGYGGDATTYYDTWIWSTNPTNNYGSENRIGTFSGACSALLKFDLSSIAAGSTCDDAKVYTYIQDQQWATKTISWHVLATANRTWTEDGATWNTKDGSNAWAGSNGAETSGTDYAASALGTMFIEQNSEVGTEHNADLTDASVDDFFGGAIHLITKSDVAGFHLDCSSDHATTGYRPKLVVEYTAGGEPPVTRKPTTQFMYYQRMRNNYVA